MSEPMPMMEAKDAGACDPDQMAPDRVGEDVVGDGESVPDGAAGGSLEELLSGEPSDTVPVTSGTYALYHATNGSMVLVLEDARSGIRTIPVPGVMVKALLNGGRRKLINPFSLFGGGRG